MSVADLLASHYAWLADRHRIEAFRAALRASVRRGDVVADIGTGTGVLAVLAAEAGAGRVYAIDEGPILGTAREIAHAHGVADRVTFVRGHSSRVELPERVDVAVADLIGHFAFEAGLFDAMADARARLLKPDGRTVPQAITLMFAPLESPALRESVARWRRRPGGLETEPLASMAARVAHATASTSAELIAPGAVLAVVAPAAAPSSLTGRARFVVSEDRVLDGVAGWFEAELVPGIRISNAPGDPQRLDRANLALPLSRPVSIHSRDAIDVNLRVLTAPQVFVWRVRIERGGAVVFDERASTFEAEPLSREDLERRTAPRLAGGQAEALRTLLDLADGCRTAVEIEAVLRARHPDLYPTPAAAAAFLTDAIARYGD